MGYGGFYALYVSDKKELLLDEVLDKHYQVCRNHVEIIEYPMIKRFYFHNGIISNLIFNKLF